MKYIVFKIVRICHSHFKCNYLKNTKNKKLFLNFFFHFLNLHETFNVLEEKMVVTATVLPNLLTVKNFVRALSKKPRYRTRFDSQHVKDS